MKIEGFRNGFVIASETDTLLLFHGWMARMDGSNVRIDLASPVASWFFPTPPNPQKVGVPTNQLPSTSSEEHRDVSQKPEKPKIQGKTRFSGSLPFHHVPTDGDPLQRVSLCFRCWNPLQGTCSGSATWNHEFGRYPARTFEAHSAGVTLDLYLVACAATVQDAKEIHAGRPL
ncbi:hypothetical protein FMEXI_13604 [Fusarium mexicanum]|uniref:Uncharacterized protein n=1 Tax=Fusarium mexicanum TaxID=751941 RepID=A0A8H5MJL3_9HYPO|nr:hypothetical protein FMEXI_13604 [Fusarium mexicanum]